MKKKLVTIISSLLLGLFILPISGCAREYDVEETMESNEKAGAVELLDDFFAETLKHTNYRVETKLNGKASSTEDILNDASVLKYKDTDTVSYTFIKDGKKIFASESEENGIYYVDDYYYDSNRLVYYGNIKFVGMVDETQCTFTCNETLKSMMDDPNKNEGEIEVIIDVTKLNNKLILKAEKKDNLVTKFSMETYEFNELSRKVECSFKYGKAKVTIPDLTDWSEMQPFY